MPAPHHDDKFGGDDIAGVVDGVVRRASPLSIGMAIVLAVIFFGVGGTLYFNKDTIVRLVEVSHDVEHLKQAHDKCHAELTAIKQQVEQLRNEMAQLKARLPNGA